jgi:hypothetical protein
MAVRFLRQPRSFLEPPAGAVEHRFNLDESGGKIGFFHRSKRRREGAYWPIAAEAMLLFAGCALRIWSVAGPLSTIRVSGSQTVERMPTGAVSRSSCSSRLISRLLRG